MNKTRIRYGGEKRSFILSFLLIIAISLVIFDYSFYLLILLILAQFLLVIITQKQIRGNSLVADEHQFKEIFDVVKENSNSLGLEPPKVYIQQDPYINAFAIGFKKPYTIVLNSALVESFTRDELDFVIGHELGHIRYGHTRLLSLINPLNNGVYPLSIIYADWQRRTEYTADRCGILSIETIRPAITAIIKMSVGNKLSRLAEMDVILEQIQQTDNDFLSQIGEILLTHPYATNRIKAIVEFKRSQ